jgi:hypothetical protein
MNEPIKEKQRPLTITNRESTRNEKCFRPHNHICMKWTTLTEQMEGEFHYPQGTRGPQQF